MTGLVTFANTLGAAPSPNEALFIDLSQASKKGPTPIHSVVLGDF